MTSPLAKHGLRGSYLHSAENVDESEKLLYVSECPEVELQSVGDDDGIRDGFKRIHGVRTMSIQVQATYDAVSERFGDELGQIFLAGYFQIDATTPVFGLVLSADLNRAAIYGEPKVGEVEQAYCHGTFVGNGGVLLVGQL